MQQRSGGILYYFTLSMTVVYALIGIYILISDKGQSFLSGGQRYFLGVFLILYAIYRAYRIVRLNKQMNEQG